MTDMMNVDEGFDDGMDIIREQEMGIRVWEQNIGLGFGNIVQGQGLVIESGVWEVSANDFGRGKEKGVQGNSVKGNGAQKNNQRGIKIAEGNTL